MFQDGKVDAVMTGPPLSFDLRTKRIGQVIVNTTTDRPWSQHFCCLITARKDFVLKNPVATKRAVRTVKELPYGRWRDYDPEASVRFYALRLHDVGMIKSSPQKIIAQGTDWRFLNELKRELKG
jgi:NitT/TauT family transport system substrate-binding protein